MLSHYLIDISFALTSLPDVPYVCPYKLSWFSSAEYLFLLKLGSGIKGAGIY